MYTDQQAISIESCTYLEDYKSLPPADLDIYRVSHNDVMPYGPPTELCVMRYDEIMPYGHCPDLEGTPQYAIAQVMPYHRHAL